MEFSIIDSQNIKYSFSFEGDDVIVSSGEKRMVMPIDLVINNSGPWQFLRDEYIKMSKEASCCIEAVCIKKAF